MRVLLTLAMAGLFSATVPEAPRRYRVVPTGQAVDAGVPPCPASLSSDGLTVAFESHTALDPADQNGRPDVYLLDRQTRRVTLVSRNLDGGTGRGTSRCPRVSGDGQRVVFESDVTDLVEGDVPGTNDIYVFERGNAALRRVALATEAGPTRNARPTISADGRVVAFDASTSDARPHVYRVLLDTMEVEDLGTGHSATLSNDGRIVAFVTSERLGAPQGIRVVGAVTRTIGPAEGRTDATDVFAPALSADGQWLAYVSRPAPAGEGPKDPGATQVHVLRLGDGVDLMVSTTPRGRAGNGHSRMPAIDATGSRVVFESSATNLGCGARGGVSCKTDINLLGDVFAWDRATATVTRVNVATPDLVWLEGAGFPAISADGSTIAFLSRQPITTADGRDTFDLFLTPYQ